MIVSGMCRGCASLAKQKIDITATKQPFIYAVGPPTVAPYSASLAAPLREHLYYGRFTMDMTQSVGNTLPRLGNGTSSGVVDGGRARDHAYAESGHGFAMVFAFLIVLPLGMLAVRVLERVRLHMIFQSIGVVFVVLGLITGLVISRNYNRVRFVSPISSSLSLPPPLKHRKLTPHVLQQSRSFNSAHQIIGLTTLVLILAQWTLGFLHHRRVVRSNSGAPALIKPHKLVLGPLVLALGLLNASLGLRLAMAYTLNWIYIGCVALLAIVLFVVSWKKPFFFRRWGSRKSLPATSPYGAAAAAASRDPTEHGVVGSSGGRRRSSSSGAGGAAHGEAAGASRPYGYASDPFATRSDIALSNMGEPPAYSAQPTKPREFA
jgi:hypothetical protein